MLTESCVPQYHNNTSNPNMAKLCRQISIETPGLSVKDCVLKCEVPVPEAVPPNGAIIRVVCAGACYRRKTRSLSTSSTSSVSSQSTEDTSYCPSHHGVRDGALFPGYEVSGIIDQLGPDVKRDNEIFIGKRIILYPYDGIPHGYSELIVVPDVKYLIPIPDKLSMGVAATLPTGALLAKSAVNAASHTVSDLLKERSSDESVKVLIVGTGGLALWTLRIAEQHFKTPEFKNRINITVATLKDESIKLNDNELKNVNIVHWKENLHEKQLIERTIDACNGLVDIVIDFGITSRSLHRSLQCLNKGGLVLLCEEVAERLLPKFSRLAHEGNKKIEPISNGTIEQLQDLVKCVSDGQITPPPHSEFSADEAVTVVQKLSQSEIPGRAILRFHDID